MNRILAVDDNLDNLVTVKALLKLFIDDCEVFTASSGSEGLIMAKKECPDVILLDIHMPEMDGFEVCQRLKDDQAVSHIPVIMLTAIKTSTQHRVKALNIGADAFLTKPINETELAAQVRAMLRIKKAEDHLRDEKDNLEKLVKLRLKDLMKANEQLMLEMEERVRIEKELRVKSNAIENSLNGFDIVDENKKFVYVNKAYVRMWGYEDASEIIGTSHEQHCEDPGIPDQIIRKLKSSGKCVIEFKAKRKDGSNFDVLMHARRAHDEQGREIYPTSSIDITEQKKAKIERDKLEKQLLQAQKMEAVGALAGGIAHDFNNILYPMIGFAEMLKEDIPGSSPLNESLDEILSAGLRAKDLVTQILAFSRQMDQEVKPVRVQKIIREVLDLLTSIIPSTITIKSKIDEECQPILADPTQIHQVIMNLATNAYHAMQDSGGTLKIALSKSSPPVTEANPSGLNSNKSVCIKISDTGEGIPIEIRDKIFNPYFTTKSMDRGTGLGLSVVHGIVRNLHGDLHVESELGRGTTISVILPVYHAESDTTEELTESTIPGGNEKILLVDDESYVVKIVTKILERRGYQVTSYTNPNEALTYFKNNQNKIDLVITDMTMPKMTGKDLSNKILDINPNMPIIICTGYSDMIDHTIARSIGIKELLMKPLVASDLARAIRKVIDDK